MQEIGTSSLWCEKYRPKQLSDLILPQNYKELFERVVKDKELPNLLLSGSAGLGKSSLCYTLANELDCDLLFINASLETGIDVLRSKVTQFASTSSFSEGKKLVTLDECLEESEKIRVGTVESGYESIPLSEMEFGIKYPIISMNMESGILENDIGELISDKNDEIFELELEDGRTIKVNKKHPFIIKDINGNLIQKSIEEGLSENDIIVSF